MGTLIKNIEGRFRIEFDQGSFDSWCVFLTRNGNRRYAPRDTEYFEFLRQMGERFGTKRLYDDFVTIYLKTSIHLDYNLLGMISELAQAYGDLAVEMDIWLSVIYAGMVAEENKKGAILKKRIKRLGVHQVLIANVKPADAAVFSKGKSWRELDAIMSKLGF
jgi:hypothetical protein